MGSSSLILQNFKTLAVGGREQERDGDGLAERQGEQLSDHDRYCLD